MATGRKSGLIRRAQDAGCGGVGGTAVVWTRVKSQCGLEPQPHRGGHRGRLARVLGVRQQNPTQRARGRAGVTVLKCWDSEDRRSEEARKAPSCTGDTPGHCTYVHLRSPTATPKYVCCCHTHFTDGHAEAP